MELLETRTGQALDPVLYLDPEVAQREQRRIFERTDHGNGNESHDQAIFDRSCTALIYAELAHSLSDSVHATLLWSTSTRRVYGERG